MAGLIYQCFLKINALGSIFRRMAFAVYSVANASKEVLFYDEK